MASLIASSDLQICLGQSTLEFLDYKVQSEPLLLVLGTQYVQIPNIVLCCLLQWAVAH